jgi:DNA-binding MarR family transcriptional regulator
VARDRADFLGSLKAMELAHLYEAVPSDDPSVATQAVGVAAILRAVRLITARVEAVLAPFDMTMARFEILGRCFASPDGRVRFADLKASTLLHAATMGHTINRLESAGLIRRRPDDLDRRAQVAEITPAGRTVAEQAIAAMASVGFGLTELDGASIRELCVLLSELER